MRFVIEGKTGHLLSSTVGLNGAFASGYRNLVGHGTVVTMRLSYVAPVVPGDECTSHSLFATSAPATRRRTP